MILPQIGSICRLYGSKRAPWTSLVGDTREAFQNETSEELEGVLASKGLSLLFGLTPAHLRPRPGPRADPAGEDRRRADQDPRPGTAHRQDGGAT